MDSYPTLGVQKSDDDTSDTAYIIASKAIDRLWKVVVRDTNFASEFNKVWIITEFELGDELTQYNCVEKLGVSCGFLTIIYQDKVRLLAFDKSLKKEVSIQYFSRVSESRQKLIFFSTH